MNEHFIKEIEIKNFKCFKDFKAAGFGRVNLIGGKNNVGKTAFMEAVFVILDTEDKETKDIISSFLRIEYFRGMSNTISGSELRDINNKYFSSEIRTNNIELKSKLKKDESFVNENAKLLFTNDTCNFIPSYMIGDDLIVSIFDKIKKQRKREQLNKILNEFDKNILEFDIIENRTQVFLENIQDFQDVAELGHGLKRYIALIGAILINKDGFLFLDEIENGIHYTNLDKLWEIILTISKKQNVQVFATTHSKECIESYARVAKKLEDKEIAFMELGRNKNKELDSIVMDSEMFQRYIKMGNEVRGW